MELKFSENLSSLVKGGPVLFLMILTHWILTAQHICTTTVYLTLYLTFSVLPVDEDTEESYRSGLESMSTSGDLSLGGGLVDDKQKDGALGGPKETKIVDKEKDKDKNKPKKGVLKGLGEMFR